MTAVPLAPPSGAIDADQSVPPGRIDVNRLTKVFGGRIRAVDALRFGVEPGWMTGFPAPRCCGCPRSASASASSW